ncbi:MAG: hypothetical protein Q9169_006200, partial [Polycauliona sp. 2 TL-2023]
KMNPAECQSNCHIINGQVQLDAPGKLIFPPTVPTPTPTPTPASSTTSPTSSTSPTSPLPTNTPLLLPTLPPSNGGSQSQMKAIPLTAATKTKAIINAIARKCQRRGGRCFFSGITAKTKADG